MRNRSAPSLWSAFAQLRKEVRNWRTVGPLTAIVMPTRIPPRRGLGGTWLGKRAVTFYMKDGSQIKCRLQDAGDPISVYLDHDYADQGINWGALRTIIDVGATTGCFTVWGSRLAPQAYIIAIEPNPDVYPYLVRNVTENGLSSRVTTVPAALGAANGIGHMINQTYSTLGSVSIGASREAKPIKVETLTQLLENHAIQHCDLLKMDCEGAEYEILLTASTQALRRIDYVVCEFHPHETYDVNQLSNRLKDAGFNVTHDIGPVGFLRARQLD